MRPYILFDLDGTLTDPGEGITNSVAYALRQFGIEVADRSALNAFIGPPLLESFARYYGFDAEKCREALVQYRVYFAERGIFENQLYPETVWLLEELTRLGAKLILATSKPEEYALRILRHFDVEQYFYCVAGASMDEKRCEKSDVIAYALQKAGIADSTACVMVGDRRHDVQGARANGIPCIGVLWGYGDEAELRAAGASAIAADMRGLKEILTTSF
jgi:phosphoglycolate phosphatase